MSLVLTTTWFGTFILRDNEVIHHILFPREPEAITKRIKMLRSGDIIEEEKQIAKLESNFLTTEERLLKLGATGLVDITPPVAQEWDFDLGLLQRAMILLGKEDAQMAITRDLSIVQAVNTIDDMTKSWNLIWERLRNWYGLHLPELEYLVPPARYVELIATYGDPRTVAQVFHGSSQISEIDGDNKSLNPEDIEALQEIAKTLTDLQKAKDELETFIEGQMASVAPNLTHLAGALIGARLIAQSGSLATLSKTPASTIQVLGAERALFRHIADGSSPPKHGIIFQHPLVNTAPYWQRGKIARTLAAKIAIAAKVDYYGGDFIGDALASEMKVRSDTIRQQFPEPPQRPAGDRTLRPMARKGYHSKRPRKRGKRKRKGRS